MAPARFRNVILDGAPVRREIPWREVIRHAAGMWLATRIIFIVLTYAYEAYFVPGTATLHALVESWHEWDSIWYIAIALRGYWYDQPTAFFPLYPALIKGVSVIMGGHAVAAALLVSSLAALPAFIGLGALTANEAWAPRSSWRTIQVTAAYPFAFFLFAPYTESLFLVGAVFCLFYARRGQWRRAAVFLLVAMLTRPTAVALGAPVLWEYGRQHGWWRWAAAQLMPTLTRLAQRRRHNDDGATGAPSGASAVGAANGGLGWSIPLPLLLSAPVRRWTYVRSQGRALLGAALVCGSIPLVLAFFMLYTWIQFGSPMLMFTVHTAHWGRVSQPIWLTIASTIHNVITLPVGDPDQATILCDVGAVALCTLLTVRYARRVPFAFTLYTAGVLYLAISTPVPTSPMVIQAAGRFLLAAFPVFMLLGNAVEERPWLELLLVGGGFLLQAIFATLFLSHVLIE